MDFSGTEPSLLVPEARSWGVTSGHRVDEGAVRWGDVACGRLRSQDVGEPPPPSEEPAQRPFPGDRKGPLAFSVGVRTTAIQQTGPSGRNPRFAERDERDPADSLSARRRPSDCDTVGDEQRGVWPGSGPAVGSEVWVSVLVEDRDDDQPVVIQDPVSHCVREAVSGELALDDLVPVVTKSWRAGVRPSGGADNGCEDRVEETVAKTSLLVLVPGPGVLEVGVDEFVVLDTKAHASR